MNRGCQDMPIIPIWKFNGVDEMFISRHQRIGQCLVHQLPGTVQFVRCKIGSILEQIAYPFVMNFGGPMSAEDTRQCEVHEEVPKPGRVENICVVKGPEYCERQMQCFFEENPFFLSQLRLGVQVPHPSYRTHRWSPDFAFTSILGASDIEDIDLLELKGPAEELLNNHKHHPGFTSILQSAINQVRDYGEYINHPGNYRKIMRQFGYIPTTSKLAVVLGRDSDDKEKMEILDKRRQYVPDVEIITYDKILETQAHQLSPIIAPTMLEVASLRIGGAVTNFLY
jgi:hypothetical protein